MSEENSKAIVIDTGAGYCKSGMAGEETPSCCFPTVYSHDPQNSELSSHLVGQEALEESNQFPKVRPIKRGMAKDWNALEHIWQHCFLAQLKLDSTEHPVLTSFYPEESKIDRENTTLIFFEAFNVPGYFSVLNSLLCLYGSGKTTGLVVDSGEELSSAVPICEGYSISHMHTVSEFGGKDIDDILMKAYPALKAPFARDLKERRGLVSLNFEEEMEKLRDGSSKPYSYELPDGEMIDVGDSLITACEALFRPEVSPISKHHNRLGVANLIIESLYKGEESLRKDLLSHVVLAGGNTLFKNMSNR